MELPEQEEDSKTSQTDPGLTAVWLVLGGPVMAQHAKSVRRNQELREQFNAARLVLGMSRQRVESILKSKPLESGKVHEGEFSIYGVIEDLDVMPDLHYCNILIVYKDAKVQDIYSGSFVPGGSLGLEKTREFLGLDDTP